MATISNMCLMLSMLNSVSQQPSLTILAVRNALLCTGTSYLISYENDQLVDG